MSSNALKSEIRLVFNDKPAASSAAQASCLAMNPSSVPTTQIYQNNNNNNNNNNINKCSNINEYRASNELEITQTSNLLDSILDAELTNLNIQIDNTSSNMYNNNNNSNTNINSNNSGGSGGMFHPTWDEWKQRAQLSNENTSKCKHESVSSQHTNTYNKHQQQHYRQQDYNRMLETNTTKSNLYKQEEIYTSNSKREDKKTVYSNKPSSPVLIRNSNTNQLEYVNESALRRQEGRSPRHYPVAGIDFLPVRAPSPVELSSCTLAKQPPLDLKTEQEAKQAPKPARPEPDTKPLVVESAHQQRKIKTILSTRKESAPNLTGWRTESDSDSDAQNRLLARASGSIPIEYISIRRDPKPHLTVDTNAKKSITTGTNTSSDRGKRIAATNTNQDELPQYNLHVSLDSLLVKSRQEASTATDVKNKTVSTETSHVGHKDAGTLTDAERSPSPPAPPPQPPKPQEQLVYTQRRSRYTEWQSPPTPAQTTYRLEMLTQSPRPKQIYHHHHHHQEHHHHSFDRTPRPPKTSVNYSLNQTIRVDDDDRLIFGHNSSSRYDNRSHEYFTRRSGSFPCLVSFDSCANNNSTHRQRYVRHTQTSNYSPFVVKRVEQVHVNRPEFELGVMPLIGGEFSEFNDKFRQVFGLGQSAGGANTRRYYKYSRTSTDNGVQCVRQAAEMPHVSSSFGRQVYQQQHNVNSSRSTVPIVEIPVTPTSTIGKSSHCYTANGPVITSMSRNASATNLNSSFSMSSTQHQQQQHKSSSSFEPVVRRVSSAARATDQHESISEQRQFRPINETVTRETHFRSSSSNGQPVPVIGQVNASRTNSFSSSNAASSSSARQNFSSSYQYSSSSKNIN